MNTFPEQFSYNPSCAFPYPQLLAAPPSDLGYAFPYTQLLAAHPSDLSYQYPENAGHYTDRSCSLPPVPQSQARQSPTPRREQKRRKKGIAKKRKGDICLFNEQHPGWSIVDIAKHFKEDPESVTKKLREANANFGRTVRSILLDKKMHLRLSSKTEDAIIVWANAERREGVHLIYKDLKAKAWDLATEDEQHLLSCTAWSEQIKERLNRAILMQIKTLSIMKEDLKLTTAPNTVWLADRLIEELQSSVVRDTTTCTEGCGDLSPHIQILRDLEAQFKERGLESPKRDIDCLVGKLKKAEKYHHDHREE